MACSGALDDVSAYTPTPERARPATSAAVVSAMYVDDESRSAISQAVSSMAAVAPIGVVREATAVAWADAAGVVCGGGVAVVDPQAITISERRSGARRTEVDKALNGRIDPNFPADGTQSRGSSHRHEGPADLQCARTTPITQPR